MNKKTFVIAIDGPVGSGKGTLTQALAAKLNALYVYTGGMYRALALLCLRENVDLHNEEKVLEIFKKNLIELRRVGNKIKAFLNGEDVSGEIFQPEISRITPVVAAFPTVRQEMIKKQRELVGEKKKEGENIIMEGRDITTSVFPDADLKIYLTADINVRAKRRLVQLKEYGVEITLEEAIRDIQERDKKDSERQASPLSIAKDAFVIDTTNDTILETVEKAMEKIREKGIA